MLPQVIYVFSTDYPLHKGCLKIGMTKLTEDCKQLPAPNDPLLIAAARERIDQYTKTAAIKYELLYTECSAFIHKGVLQSFDDKQVHSVLLRSGIRRPDFSNEGLGKEWFETDLATVKNAISAAKEGRSSLFPEEKTQTEPAPIVFRPEQREAIDKAVKHFTKNKGKGQRKMLWNCKMRFGKTLSALQVVREMGARRTLIVTHRPVVNAGWYEDFEKIFYDLRAAEPVADGNKSAGAAKKGELQGKYNYGSAQKGERLDQLLLQADEGAHIVCFASLQDLRGSEDVGGKHEKNDNIFATDWDLLIVDEAHEGTQTELGQAVIDQLRHADTKVLQLSGTPFNLFDQYDEDEIFTWDYIMEQRAKTSWDEYHVGDSNPYASLPAMHIYTYDLGRLMNRFADEDKVFNFREFFRTDEQGAFVHDDYVGDFLDLLCCDDEDSLYPYAKADFRRIFRHTLWVVPGVKAAKALSKKLQAHPVFGAFTVVNVAGEGDADEESRDALEKVNKAIGKDPSATYTITLSCGRLTTGVSIRPWTGVFLLAGSSSTSAAGYMQTIFRVQTPFEYQGRVKENCYAFDFAPDRALRMLAEASKVSYKAGKQTAEDRHTLADFLSFCPVIALEGSQMKAFNVDNLLTQLKRVQIERVVNAGFEDGALYNDELLRLEDADVADFNGLRAKIGTTKALKPVDKVKVSDNGLDGNNAKPPAAPDKKPSKESDPEAEAQKALENERKKQRKNAIAILRGISIRMPLLIYGADLHDEAVELTIDNFVHLIDDTSWTEFMPAGVTKADFARFKRYYDPEVFSAAGRRIRQLARSADKFTIEERISRLTALFSTFRNPDKETVLTPWRVVNLHLSDSLGGYCFMDERFEHPLETPRHIVRSGEAMAQPEWGHGVHVQVGGLAPDRWYHYRFMLGQAVSGTGRCRTAPAPGSMPQRLRLAYASCQRWEHGYYAAWRQVVQDAPDLVIFLGDYIYEYATPAMTLGLARTHNLRAAQTLQDYRDRYALHKSDPLLQAAHALCNWSVGWDDHEVENNYAGDQGQGDAARFLARRMAAWQAFYENMPLRASALTGAGASHGGGGLQLYRSLQWGRLARLHLLDGRPYRSAPACRTGSRGWPMGEFLAACEHRGSERRHAADQASSAISSISTQEPSGIWATPKALRACVPASPKTWPSSSLQPLATRCCSV